MVSAIMCIAAPMSFPIGAVPVSLATLVIYMASAVLGGRNAVISVIIYLMIGIAGIPVFSAFSSGIGTFLGPTGGYIIGYIPCAYIIGAIAERSRKNIAGYIFGTVFGTVVLYIFGTAWFMIQSLNGLYESIIICVLPFIFGDIVKILIAVLLYKVIAIKNIL